MAWEVTAYGITAAVLVIAVASVFGIVRVCRSLRGLDRAVERLGSESEASLLVCRQLAEEARSAVAASKQSLQGFSALAEGARALGEAVQTAAQTAAHATAICREHLASFVPSSTSDKEELRTYGSPWADASRALRKLWRAHSESKEPSSECRDCSGPSAEPSQGV
jgi:hypothetical protein